MSRNLPPLSALLAFEVAARHQSMTRAAAELNVAQAAISRHVATLEAALQVTLFERTGRGVVLTEDGRTLAQSLTLAFDTIALATSDYTQRSRRRQRLTITSDSAFAMHWLVPRLKRFTIENPDVELILDATPRLVDFDRETVDLGIRFGNGDWRNVTSEKLVAADWIVVCSPKLLNSIKLRSPSDLPGHLLLQDQDRAWWTKWLDAAGVGDDVKPSGPTLLADLTLSAAEAGQGFALTDQCVAENALAAGRLVAPFDIKCSFYGYYLVSGNDARSSRAAKRFRDWIIAEIEKDVSRSNSSRSSSRRRPGPTTRPNKAR